VKSAILAGVGDYVIHDTEMDFPKNWPIPDSVPRPITGRAWAEEGGKILERGEVVPEHLASASLIAARVGGADPKVLAAVIRGAVAPMWPAEPLRTIDVPVKPMQPTRRWRAFLGRSPQHASRPVPATTTRRPTSRPSARR